MARNAQKRICKIAGDEKKMSVKLAMVLEYRPDVRVSSLECHDRSSLVSRLLCVTSCATVLFASIQGEQIRRHVHRRMTHDRLGLLRPILVTFIPCLRPLPRATDYLMSCFTTKRD